jgi:hypothetical protein
MTQALFLNSWAKFAILHSIRFFIYIEDVVFNCLCSISFTLFICLSQSHARVELSKINYAMYGFLVTKSVWYDVRVLV